MDCGTTALAMILKSYGFFNVRHFLSQEAEVTTEGVDLYTISELAEGFGFETDGYQMGYDHLMEVQLPCIAHYEGNHFVVVYRITKDKVCIADPGVGKYTLDREGFEKKWNGIILALNPGPELFQHNELTELAREMRERRQGIWKAYYLSTLRASCGLLLRIFGITLLLLQLTLVLPFITQIILDEVLVNQNLRLLYAILLALLLVFGSQVLLSYGRNVWLADFRVAFERNFFSKFFDHLIHLQQSYFDRHSREDFITRFGDNVKIRNAMNPTVLESLIDFAFLPLYLLVLFLFNVQLSLVVLAFVIVYMVVIVSLSRKVIHLENRVFTAKNKTLAKFLDALLGIQSVQLLGIEKLQFWQWKNSYTRGLNQVVDASKMQITLNTWLNTLIFAVQMVIYWLGAFYTFQGQLSIGSYIAYTTLFTLVLRATQNLRQLWFFFTELTVTFDRLNDVFAEPRRPRSSVGKADLESPVAIRMQDLRFKYRPRDDHYNLKDVNLSIAPGEFVGIVGRNGSGKTTLVKLLANFYSEYEGEILLNGTELRQLSQRAWQRTFSFIPQDVYLFDASLKQNIAFGNPNATDEEIFAAAEKADLVGLVQKNFTGFNLMIGETGVNLSGGERLKVAFARLFLSNPDIIILDEASSALDVETERLLMDRVHEQFHDKTIISIAHRLHTLRTADKILVMDQGSIVQQGTHEHLKDQPGVYQTFMNSYINV
ncbi:MAG TPA: hypothetical protein DCE41_27985 [Cytophagales bacterium]|nr:hypothetical protein [Cytophagales bacterium]